MQVRTHPDRDKLHLNQAIEWIARGFERLIKEMIDKNNFFKVKTKFACLAIALLICVGVAGAMMRSRKNASLLLSQPSEQSMEPELKPAPPTPIAEKKEELGEPSWDPEWDKIVEQDLPPDLLTSSRVAADLRYVCPRYRILSEADKRAYWAYFFQALAAAEAGLKPTADVRHTEPEVAVVDTVTRRMVRSEGLLQLTYMDADRYGCDFDWDRDKHLAEKDPNKTILLPKNNLLCGIRILDNQLIAQNKPLFSSTSYWSPLHPGTAPYGVFRKQMVNMPDVCRRTPAKGSSNKSASRHNQRSPAEADSPVGTSNKTRPVAPSEQ